MGPKLRARKALKSLSIPCPVCLAADFLQVSRVATSLAFSLILNRLISGSSHLSSLTDSAPSPSTSRASWNSCSEPPSQPRARRPLAHSSGCSNSSSARVDFMVVRVLEMVGCAIKRCAVSFSLKVMSLGLSKVAAHHLLKEFHSWACSTQISSKVISPESSGSSSLQMPSALPLGNLSRAMPTLNSFRETRPLALRSKCRNQAFSSELSLSSRKALSSSCPDRK
mmetsp:Transcript_28862/g.89872  ORF Transcript_28862/g.89872 Transcript_28862/m.89872 type:complete len:225 (+) Transcript_28862:1604-2278(+)